jgi:glycine cleavage system H protein
VSEKIPCRCKSLVKVGDFEVTENLYYSKDWMWVKVEDSRVRIGITDYAQKQLKEVVFAELPAAGAEIKKGESFGTVESVKTVSELVAPVSGKIEEVNKEVARSPEKLNQDPYGEGWILIVSPTELDKDLGTLMDFAKSIEWHKEIAREG